MKDFKKLTNIETSVKQLRLIVILFLLLCGGIVLFCIYSSFRFAEKQRERIYVLDEGKSLMLALSQDLQQNRPAEGKEHVRRFHELFFTLSPDKSAIESNIERALSLSDKSTWKYYNDLAEKGYYTRLIAGNISQVIQVDSIRCDFQNYPYDIRTYARQIILRESSVTERTLFTRCKLINTSRSDSNPHGFIIENFEVVENKLLSEYAR